MKTRKIYLALLITAFFIGCQKDDDNIDNKLFFSSLNSVKEILVKGGDNEQEGVLKVSLVKTENVDISLSYEVRESLVKTYNNIYYDKATMLPENNYNIESIQAKIEAGNISSNQTRILFKNLNNLDREKRYVLPVTIAKTSFKVLESDRTKYFVFKGADLINIVADIEENYLLIDWTNPDVCNNLSQLTMEALVRARNFDRLISTVMGIEGQFLLRIGDAGFPQNQIMVALRRGKFPDADPNKGLPINEWVHIALTYSSIDKKMIIYINGKKQSEGSINVGTVDLGKKGSNGFAIGRSYNNGRFFAGEISECRIWNTVRTPEEIKSNPYLVDPSSKGLVAYWKFNDESNLSVLDHTNNGNNAIANAPLKWTKVSLPETE